MTAARNWSAVALSGAIEAGSTSGIVLDGQEVVLWRDAQGQLHAWEDRCPHRGMRLSFGAVRGDRLACLYHGWQYDGTGQCRKIPAHPDLEPSKAIQATAHHAHEAFGLIWLSIGAGDPWVSTLAETAVTPLRSLALDVPLAAVVAALAATDLSVFAGTSTAKTRLDAVEGQTAFWILANAFDHLLIAGQIVDDGRSALHIVILGAPDLYTGPGQIHFARWAEQFRARVERSYNGVARDVA